MREKGQFSFLTVALIFGLFILQLVFAAFYTSHILGEGVNDLQNDYLANVVAEQALSAECATESRGIFYESAIRSGRLRCISPCYKAHLKFEYDARGQNREHAWLVEDTGEGFTHSENFGIRVEAVSDATFTETYNVLILNKTNRTTYPATMRVGGEWRDKVC
jgi:hypothetical protein